MMKNTLFRMDGSDEFVLRICERCMEDGLPGNAKAGREDLERICTPFVNMLGKLSQGNSGAKISGIK